MGVGKLVGQIDVLVPYGVEHQRVLVGQQIALMGPLQIFEMQMQHALALRQELLVERGEILVFSGMGDRHVEFLVGFRHGEMIACPDRRFEGLQPLGDDLQVGLGSEGRGQPRVHALGDVERLDIFRKGRHFDGRDDRAAVGKRDDQLVGAEPDQRFAHRRARHVEAFGKRHLVEELTGRQNERQDLVAKRFIDAFPAGPTDSFHFRFIRHLGPFLSTRIPLGQKNSVSAM
ncbi:hypothetical protein RHECNPAF_1700094 [Rhizobium etli CNPAF512]|nr:hypothetical protein RHECNPAF_1700094 [Rhizobium etli CNPAF512]